jgi:hypothetical protein
MILNNHHLPKIYPRSTQAELCFKRWQLVSAALPNVYDSLTTNLPFAETGY